MIANTVQADGPGLPEESTLHRSLIASKTSSENGELVKHTELARKGSAVRLLNYVSQAKKLTSRSQPFTESLSTVKMDVPYTSGAIALI